MTFQISWHGLGGALATLAAYELADYSVLPVQCVTWGSPRVGNKAFKKRCLGIEWCSHWLRLKVRHVTESKADRVVQIQVFDDV